MLEIRNLSKQFDGNYVLKNINMEIQAGQVYGLIGANGSGKSTLMNVLNGNETISSHWHTALQWCTRSWLCSRV